MRELDELSVVLPTITPQRNARSPKHRRTIPQTSTNINHREKHRNTDLTRFGLDAYVLGSRKGEAFY